MVLSIVVHPYVPAQMVPWLVRGDHVPQREERGAYALAPLVCPPGIHHQNLVVSWGAAVRALTCCAKSPYWA